MPDFAYIASREYYPEAVIQSICDVLVVEAAPLARWNVTLEVMESHKIPYKQVLSPEMLLCHPCNRGGLGLNSHNVGRTGANIKAVGADLDALKKSTCFELHPAGPDTGSMRQKQLTFNQKQVESSQGRLAKVSGAERYASVSTGHTVGVCRAANAGCKTSDKRIADESGVIAKAFLETDAVFKVMLNVGWTWTIIPWQVEATFPHLPELAQLALNVGNHVPTQSSELESGCTIAEYVEMQLQNGGTADWHEAEEAASLSLPPCKDYIATISKYTRLYGGPDAENIRFLDSFAKGYGENRRLGAEFWSALTEMQFEKTKPFPYLRTAFAATQLIAPKTVDGIARMLTPADFRAMKQKSSVAEEVDTLVEGAWDIVKKASAAKPEHDQFLSGALGRLMARACLNVTGKTKLLFEEDPNTKTTLADVKRMFSEEVFKCVTDEARRDPWFKGFKPEAAAKKKPCEGCERGRGRRPQDVQRFEVHREPEWLHGWCVLFRIRAPRCSVQVGLNGSRRHYERVCTLGG